jgi:sugar lactone lactonase YvrE
MKSKRIRLLVILIIAIGIVGAYMGFRRLHGGGALPLSVTFTVAGAQQGTDSASFEDPFGITVGADGAIYVSDGEKGRIWQIKPDGTAKIIIENLDTPSGVTTSRDGSLVIAETGAHVIRRVFPGDGRSEVIAGTSGQAGFADGKRTETLFNGPIGVAVDANDKIYVADTYNDRIRVIDKDGTTRTIAGGGQAGFVDSQNGMDARFNTPCGIAVSRNGVLIIADTGNHRIRAIENDGSVRTIAGSGKRGSDDGFLFSSTFDEPVGIAVDTDGTIFVADSRGSRLRVCGWNGFPRVWTLAGEVASGFRDGERESARINHPMGIALANDGSILFTDNANKIVRGISDAEGWGGKRLGSDALLSRAPTAPEIRSGAPPRWPYDPPDRPREIAATFGEIRGELTATDKVAWFHNGLDIPGAYGEKVRAIRGERILSPIAVADVGSARERIRFPMLGYIHLHIGRDASDNVLNAEKFVVQRNVEGSISALRVRRGTRFEAGEVIGTLNNQNHVHLTAGQIGNEFNALIALELPGIKDTVAPTIESDGIRLFDSSWREFRADGKDERVNIAGDLRIVVRAYDQMNGNATRRGLGVYRLGYQILTSGGTPATDFEDPKMTISFERLPSDDASASIAYAAGSRAGATGETIFAYIVTNIVRDKEAKESYLATSVLSPGDYNIRVFAEDFFGNRTTQDIQVRVVAEAK